jgi:hypothetical protein
MRKATNTRRRYQADPMAMFKTLNKIQLFTPEEQAKLTAPARLCFEKLRTGVGQEPDFHLLAACVNVTMILAEKIDPLAERVAVDARDACMRLWQRFNRTGLLGFDGPGLQDIPPALDLHDQLMALLTPLQVAEAANEVNNRMQAGEVLQ